LKRGKIYDWIPLWRNKWIMGSTRWELSPAERSVFIDFLCLAGSDDGFIRANPITPYPIEYLAGMLQTPADLIRETIEKCISVGKITRLEDGILYINSWGDYQLGSRSKRKLMEDQKGEGGDRYRYIDDTERSAGSGAEMGRVLGPAEKSVLDKEIEKLKVKGAALEAKIKKGTGETP